MITDDPIRSSDYVDEDAGAGAIVTFAGVVRSRNAGRNVTKIDYECYREMAEREIARLIDETVEGYGIQSARVVHRVGTVRVGETSLVVVVKSSHRREAFAAAQHLIDEVKRRIPIWKKEHYDDATSAWL